jgi:ferrous iron transport protein A
MECTLPLPGCLAVQRTGCPANGLMDADFVLTINRTLSNFKIFFIVQWGRREMVLSELKEGQWAVIERIGGSGALRRRILEMGIIKGVWVYVEKYAPLRDPLELIIKGTHISLRVEEASQISIVRPDTEEPHP